MNANILYTFRRCPYAMRARLAIQSSGVQVELREIVLRDKAPEFVAASAKATVPVLQPAAGDMLEESYDIMRWALAQNDPEDWLHPLSGDLAGAEKLILQGDGEFKTNLDNYKYADRKAGDDGKSAREQAGGFLDVLNGRLENSEYLYGGRISLADMAIAPFVRQFANIDRTWFDAQDWPFLQRWLNDFLSSERFLKIMKKYSKWQTGDLASVFPER